MAPLWSHRRRQYLLLQHAVSAIHLLSVVPSDKV